MWRRLQDTAIADVHSFRSLDLSVRRGGSEVLCPAKETVSGAWRQPVAAVAACAQVLTVRTQGGRDMNRRTLTGTTSPSRGAGILARLV